MLQSVGRLASCRAESMATISGDSEGTSVSKCTRKHRKGESVGGGRTPFLGALYKYSICKRGGRVPFAATVGQDGYFFVFIGLVRSTSSHQ